MLGVVDRLLGVGLFCLARLFYRAEIENVLSSLERQLSRVDRFGDHASFRHAVNALIAAEDRRFMSHSGVDVRGVARAFAVYVSRRRLQGASTITQQLVRVVTRDYRRSVERKLKELCIACVVDRRVSKIDQAELYLVLGYYGWRMNGLRQALLRLSFALPLKRLEAAQLVARLRYPEPASPTLEQASMINRRANYIAARMEG